MNTRRLGAIGGCDARTQGAPVSAEIRVRLRTQLGEPTQRAAERGQAVECFFLIRVLKPLFGGAGPPEPLATVAGRNAGEDEE